MFLMVTQSFQLQFIEYSALFDNALPADVVDKLLPGIQARLKKTLSICGNLRMSLMTDVSLILSTHVREGYSSHCK